MKTAFASALVALLPAFINATPLMERQGPNDTNFTISAIESVTGSHQIALNADNTLFYSGGTTHTICTVDNSQCPPGTETVLFGLLGVPRGGVLGMSVAVPSGQSVYIAGPNEVNSGALKYSFQHASPPVGAIVNRFDLSLTDLKYLDGSFFACPTSAGNGQRIITTANSDPACVGVDIKINLYKGPVPAAYAYASTTPS